MGKISFKTLWDSAFTIIHTMDDQNQILDDTIEKWMAEGSEKTDR